MKRASRIVSLLLSAVLLSSLLAPPSRASAQASGMSGFSRTRTAPAFSDVPSDAWYYENVKAVCEYGLMVGKSDTVFDPEAPVTVEEAVTVAARIHSIYHAGTADIPNPFSNNVPWYIPYKHYAGENGISCVVQTGEIPRVAFAALISRALPDEALPVISEVEDDAVPDLGVNVWDASEAYRLYRAGILTGNDEAGTFTPYRTLRRCEAAAILTRVADPALRRAVVLKASPGSAPAMTEENVRKQIEAATSQQIYRLDLADYDSDGTKEAFVLTMDADPGPDGETDPGYLWFVSGNSVSLLDASNSGSVLTFSDAPLCPVSESRTLYLFTWGSDDFPYGSDLWYGKSSLWGVSGSRPVPYRLDNITLGPDETGVSLMETRFLPESGLFRVHALVFSSKIPTPGRGLFDFRYDPVTDALVEIPAP